MSEESNRRTKGSRGSHKDVPQGKVRGSGKGPTWEDALEQGQKDKDAKLRRIKK